MSKPKIPALQNFTNRLALVLLATLLSVSAACAEETASSAPEAEATAMVSIDGNPLFPLRGVSAFPAEERASDVQKRIVAFASDDSLDVSEFTIVHTEDADIIRSSRGNLMHVFDADAEVEGIPRDILSKVFLEKIKEAVLKFRHDRTPSVLAQNALYALGVVLVTGLLLWAVIRLFRWLDELATRHVQRNIDKLADKSHQLISGAPVWKLFAGFLHLLRLLTIILLVYFLLNTVLGLFPWTRPIALMLFALVLNPIESMVLGFIDAIPGLAFLLILFLIVRYFLKAIRLFFRRVESGNIKLENFDNDWAMPTYKILRLLIIAFAVVIAYPYIPGSDSSAFKGVSVFLGVIFSLGSSSFIAGMIAGLTMTYRGAFKEGDRVKIDDVIGTVTDIRLMVTRVLTPKNEVVVIPNTNILNNNVINYSTMARNRKLILHTVVGIGYDTPWRQVEALLLMAAERTEGLLKEPGPFVLQKLLGDFAVNYELNAYCDDEFRMPSLYSSLHANIQDVFNEFGVQIMSPAYETDPESAKIVPKEHWYAAPARNPE